MDYALVENGIITGVIVIGDQKDADFFHALPLKPGQGIGDIYEAPKIRTQNDDLIDEIDCI